MDVRLSNKILAAYSLPAIPLAMLITPIIIYLPAFYAGHIGIGLSALAAILVSLAGYHGGKLVFHSGVGILVTDES